MIELTGEKIFVFDQECLLCLREASNNNLESANEKINYILQQETDGFLFKKWDFMFYKGVFEFLIGNYKNSIEYFFKADNSLQTNWIFDKDEGQGLIIETNSFSIHENRFNIIISYIQVIKL